MKKVTREQAMRLLKKYDVPLGCVEHCLEVERIALQIADQLIKNRVRIDRKFLSVAALLHDIGRYKIAVEKGTPKELGGLHAPEGQLLLEKMDYRDLAEIAGGHFLIDVSKKDAKALGWPISTRLPNILEAEIICIADKMRGKGRVEEEIQTILNREDMDERYWDKCPGLKQKVMDKSMAIIKELRKLGWNGKVSS